MAEPLFLYCPARRAIVTCTLMPLHHSVAFSLHIPPLHLPHLSYPPCHKTYIHRTTPRSLHNTAASSAAFLFGIITLLFILPPTRWQSVLSSSQYMLLFFISIPTWTLPHRTFLTWSFFDANFHRGNRTLDLPSIKKIYQSHQ
jgi:hypothetical protein